MKVVMENGKRLAEDKQEERRVMMALAEGNWNGRVDRKVEWWLVGGTTWIGVE